MMPHLDAGDGDAHHRGVRQAPPATIHPAGQQRALAALRREFEDDPRMETLLTRGNVNNIIDTAELNVEDVFPGFRSGWEHVSTTLTPQLGTRTQLENLRRPCSWRSGTAPWAGTVRPG